MSNKQTFALVSNVDRFIADCGPDNVGFLTLTFPDNVTDHKEAQSRFNSMASNYLRSRFGGYILVKERQKRGAWHYHLLIDTRQPIRTQGRWIGKKFRANHPQLTALWAELRQKMAVYGFGRHELLPIRTTAAQMARYMGKYLSKTLSRPRDPRDQGARIKLVVYAQSVRRAIAGRFGWAGPRSAELRHEVQLVAQLYFDSKNEEQISDMLGHRWAFFLYPLAFLRSQTRKMLAFNAAVAGSVHGSTYADYDIIDGQLVSYVSGECLF